MQRVAIAAVLGALALAGACAQEPPRMPPNQTFCGCIPDIFGQSCTREQPYCTGPTGVVVNTIHAYYTSAPCGGHYAPTDGGWKYVPNPRCSVACRRDPFAHPNEFPRPGEDTVPVCLCESGPGGVIFAADAGPLTCIDSRDPIPDGSLFPPPPPTDAGVDTNVDI